MPDLDLDLSHWELPEPAHFISRRLAAAGHQCYVVGGAVRDLLLGKEPGDFDLATSADPLEIVRIFYDCKRRVDGIRHGTVGLIFYGVLYELTSFRCDGAYKDHRRPDEVVFSRSLADDIFRRDFTINALAYNPQEGLLDLCGGLEDLRLGLIRCVGRPQRRFAEDALRILRAYRFASVCGFALEEKTRRAALSRLGDLRYVAAERLRAELFKLMLGEFFAPSWPLLQELLRRILPVDEALPDHGVQAQLQKLPPDFAVRLAFLLKPLTEEARETIVKGLRLSRKEGRTFKLFNRVLAERPDTQLLRLMRFARENALDLKGWAELAQLKSEATGRAESLYWQVVFAQIEDMQNRGLPLHPGQLKINGEDLMVLGFRSSRRLGNCLDRLWEEVILGRIKNEVPDLLSQAYVLLDEMP